MFVSLLTVIIGCSLFGITCLSIEIHAKSELKLVEPAIMMFVLLVEIIMIGFLYSYHINLILVNLTTNEAIKKTFEFMPRNPFAIPLKNCNIFSYIHHNLKCKNLIGRIPYSLLPKKISRTKVV